jgi:hypothetical protein
MTAAPQVPNTLPPGSAWRRATRSPVARCSRRAHAVRGAEPLRSCGLLPQPRDEPTPHWAPSTEAVTATARKIAVLFYNAVQHGMEYVDPGASSYETRYRARVIDNLDRRAKAFGFVLEVLRDPSHVCMYPLSELASQISGTGLKIEKQAPRVRRKGTHCRRSRTHRSLANNRASAGKGRRRRRDGFVLGWGSDFILSPLAHDCCAKGLKCLNVSALRQPARRTSRCRGRRQDGARNG